MKKLVFILTCIMGLVCLSSCRSTSTSCGLADNSSVNQTMVSQTTVV
ncbi:MAG: hypothetical protein ACKVK4_04160 [Flavobacteriales bacterium]|nr:hypothetical protein [Polaribacter sp.]